MLVVYTTPVPDAWVWLPGAEAVPELGWVRAEEEATLTLETEMLDLVTDIA